MHTAASQAVHVTDLIFMLSFVTYTGALKAVYAAVVVRDTDPFSKLIATQRWRYTALGVGQVVMAAPALALLAIATPDEIKSGMQSWWSVGDVIGYLCALSVVIAFTSPILTLFAAAAIYWWPAAMAMKVGRGRYIPTLHRRAGEPMIVTPQVARRGGRIVRSYEPCESVFS